MDTTNPIIYLSNTQKKHTGGCHLTRAKGKKKWMNGVDKTKGANFTLVDKNVNHQLTTPEKVIDVRIQCKIYKKLTIFFPFFCLSC
jgi:hypothetical protein